MWSHTDRTVIVTFGVLISLLALWCVLENGSSLLSRRIAAPAPGSGTATRGLTGPTGPQGPTGTVLPRSSIFIYGNSDGVSSLFMSNPGLTLGVHPLRCSMIITSTGERPTGRAELNVVGPTSNVEYSGSFPKDFQITYTTIITPILTGTPGTTGGVTRGVTVWVFKNLPVGSTIIGGGRVPVITPTPSIDPIVYPLTARLESPSALARLSGSGMYTTQIEPGDMFSFYLENTIAADSMIIDFFNISFLEI